MKEKFPINNKPIERKELENCLDKLTRKQRKIFATRLAIRLYPLLAYRLPKNGQWFGYWKAEDRAKNMFAVIRAIEYAINSVENVDAAAAYAYAYVADAAADAYAADDAAAYAAYAYADAAADAYAADARGLYWQTLRYDLANIDTLSLADKLWQFDRPKEWDTYEANLKTALTELGMPILFDDYQRRAKGNFDTERTKRYVNISDETPLTATALQSYLSAYAEDIEKLAEARVIVLGDGAAGKTSFLKVLGGGEVNKDERTTVGVEIERRKESINGQEMLVHYWDFGGQINLHPTHQFFLRNRCVYVLLFSAREAQGRDYYIEYWLEHIKLFGGSSPTVIVQNKVDVIPSKMETSPPFTIYSIQERYPFVDGFYNLSCTEKTGLPAIKKTLDRLIYQNVVLDGRNDIQKSICNLKDKLYEEQKSHNAINKDRVFALAKECGMKTEDEINVAVTMLDQLGVSLHFPTADDNFYVLNPDWLTKLVYRILWQSDEHHLGGRRGILSPMIIENMLNKKPDEADVDLSEITIESERIPTLIRIMEKFELLYHVQGDTYLAPMLTPHDIPNDRKQLRDPCRQERLHAPYMLPSALFYRFVTLCGREREISRVDDVWQQGAFLEKYGVVARVEWQGNERQIVITLYGDSERAGQYLTLLRQRLYPLIDKDYAAMKFDIYTSIYPKYLDINIRNMLRDLSDGIPIPINKNEREPALQVVNRWLGNPQDYTAVVPDIEALLMRQEIRHKDEIISLERRNNEHLLQILKLPKEQVHIQLSQIQNSEQNINVTVNNNIIQKTQDLDQELDNLLYEIAEATDEKESHPAYKKIERARQKIDEYNKVTGQDVVATAKRKSILKTIQEYTKEGLELCKTINNVADAVHKVSPVLKSLFEIATQWMM